MEIQEQETGGKKLRPWEKAWVNPKFVFKNPRCLRSKIPATPTCAYDAAMREDEEPIEDIQATKETNLEDVSIPKLKTKPQKEQKYRSYETLAEWKQRRRKFVQKEDQKKPEFSTRIGFPYSDLPMEPKREAERVLPAWPAGMTRAERRHWETWENGT